MKLIMNNGLCKRLAKLDSMLSSLVNSMVKMQHKVQPGDETKLLRLASKVEVLKVSCENFSPLSLYNKTNNRKGKVKTGLLRKYHKWLKRNKVSAGDCFLRGRQHDLSDTRLTRTVVPDKLRKGQLKGGSNFHANGTFP